MRYPILFLFVAILLLLGGNRPAVAYQPPDGILVSMYESSLPVGYRHALYRVEKSGTCLVPLLQFHDPTTLEKFVTVPQSNGSPVFFGISPYFAVRADAGGATNIMGAPMGAYLRTISVSSVDPPRVMVGDSDGGVTVFDLQGQELHHFNLSRFLPPGAKPFSPSNGLRQVSQISDDEIGVLTGEHFFTIDLKNLRRLRTVAFADLTTAQNLTCDAAWMFAASPDYAWLECLMTGGSVMGTHRVHSYLLLNLADGKILDVQPSKNKLGWKDATVPVAFDPANRVMLGRMNDDLFRLSPGDAEPDTTLGEYANFFAPGRIARLSNYSMHTPTVLAAPPSSIFATLVSKVQAAEDPDKEVFGFKTAGELATHFERLFARTPVRDDGKPTAWVYSTEIAAFYARVSGDEIKAALLDLNDRAFGLDYGGAGQLVASKKVPVRLSSLAAALWAKAP